MKRSNIQKVSALELVVNRTVNYRDDYDVPSMAEDIRIAGRVTEPIHVLKEGNIVLRGNRRVTAVQQMLADGKLPSDLRDAIAKLDVIYLSDMTEKEITEYVLDHGSQKPLTRVEVLKAAWRLQRQMYSERDIITMLYQLLARYTGNTRKAYEAQQLPQGEAREKFLSKWLHGTVGNYMLPGGTMGEFVREQFILTDLAQDRNLTDEEKEKWKMTVTRDRISALVSAKKKDKETSGWTPENGGETFNAKIAEFIAEDARPEGAASGPKKITSAQMETTAEAMQSGFRFAFLKCAGKLPEDQNAKLEALDTEYFRRDKVFAVLNQNADRITDANVQTLIRKVMVGTDADVTAALAPFVS